MGPWRETVPHPCKWGSPTNPLYTWNLYQQILGENLILILKHSPLPPQKKDWVGISKSYPWLTSSERF